MGKFTKHLQTATIVRKSKIRYIQFNGKNYELIVDYIMSKNWDNDVLSESSESIIIEIDGRRKYVYVGDYVVWDVFSKKLSIMNAEEWKKFSENFV